MKPEAEPAPNAAAMSFSVFAAGPSDERFLTVIDLQGAIAGGIDER